jgi:putative membrane protein
VDGGRTRLHPLTPVLRGLRGLAIAVAVLSWRGYAELGIVRWTAVAAAVLVLAVAGAVVSWLVTGYQVTGRELRVTEGLLWRRTRTIPLERLQAVDVVRPVLARLAGLAELRLEVVGARRAEAPLAYLSAPDAARLRTHLLALAGPAATAAPALTAPAGPLDPAGALTAQAGPLAPTGQLDPATGVLQPADAPAAERLVHAVDNRQLLLGQLLTPHLWILPVALALTVLPYVGERRWSFVAVGSLLTAVIGVVQVPARRILDDWHFRIGADHSGLRLHHGLLNTRNQTVPLQRVQAVDLTWPLLWRLPGWVSAHIDVAGYGQHDRDAGMRSGVLLPVADAPTARRVVVEVLGVDVTTLALAPPPARARWLAPLRQPVLGIGFTPDVVLSRDGWLRRRLVIASLARVQSVRVVQGPLQRLLRLATLHVDTAGALRVTGELRDADEAYALAATLAAASRAARARTAAYPRSASPTAANVTPT